MDESGQKVTGPERRFEILRILQEMGPLRPGDLRDELSRRLRAADPGHPDRPGVQVTNSTLHEDLDLLMKELPWLVAGERYHSYWLRRTTEDRLAFVQGLPDFVKAWHNQAEEKERVAEQALVEARIGEGQWVGLDGGTTAERVAYKMAHQWNSPPPGKFHLATCNVGAVPWLVLIAEQLVELRLLGNSLSTCRQFGTLTPTFAGRANCVAHFQASLHGSHLAVSFLGGYFLPDKGPLIVEPAEKPFKRLLAGAERVFLVTSKSGSDNATPLLSSKEWRQSQKRFYQYDPAVGRFRNCATHKLIEPA